MEPEEKERLALENLKAHARRVAKEIAADPYLHEKRIGIGLVDAAVAWAEAEAAVPPAETRERVMRAALESLATGHHESAERCQANLCPACEAGHALNEIDRREPPVRG